jgi:protein-disulfide isomerase
MPQIEKDYINTGKIKYVFMDFPLPMHGQAMKASEATLCAGDHDKFWEMHDRLFTNQNALSPEALSNYAESLGLDTAQFKECLDSGKQAARIKAAMAEGQKAGITGTPGFLFGFIGADGKVKATEKISGAVPYANFKATIDEMLSSKK